MQQTSKNILRAKEVVEQAKLEEPENTVNKYAVTIQSSITPTKAVTADVYCVLRAFGVQCPAVQHAIKKLLMPGKRGAKSARQDLEEAAKSIERAIELESGP